MSRDDDHDIPSFAASRDEAVTSAPRGAPPSARPRGAAAPASGGGGSVLGRLVLTVAFVAAAVACAWAWQLQMAMDQTQRELAATIERVSELELYLSDTDETFNQRATKINEDVDFWKTEIRKLWDWRNKEAKPALEKLETQMSSANTNIKRLRTASDEQGNDLKTMRNDLAQLKKLSGDLERMAATAKRAQTDVERLADGVNKATLERAALNKRVDSNEEWIESINAFRRQVNANISRLESQIRAVNSAPPAQPLQ
ncbi:MAG: hypothetical protein V2I45_05710 [Halieaceae bacterium]|jgi:chromosome segregation ATPase|nr:hypothetical protein [Halieaceae bacterium]